MKKRADIYDCMRRGLAGGILGIAVMALMGTGGSIASEANRLRLSDDWTLCCIVFANAAAFSLGAIYALRHDLRDSFGSRDQRELE